MTTNTERRKLKTVHMNNLYLRVESMANIERIYHNKKPNGHWFDKNTLSFFGSKLPEYAYALNSNLNATYDKPSDNWYYFISSEKHPYPDFQHMVRRYTIRALDTRTGDMETVGEFGAYPTKDQARNALGKILGVNTI